MAFFRVSDLRGEGIVDGEEAGLGGGVGCLLPPSCSACPPCKVFSSHPAVKGLQASGDPWAPQEINGVREGKVGSASSSIPPEPRD